MHDLGILFVHGIGRQERGETLMAFGEPLRQWLERRLNHTRHIWLRGDGRGLKVGLSKQELQAWAERKHLETNEEALEILERMKEEAKPGSERAARRIEELAVDSMRSVLAAHVEIHTAVLRPLPDDPRAPAHGTLEIRVLTVDGEVQRRRWLLAESCWADAFPPPRFWHVAKWGLLVVPWTISSHFGARFRRALAEIASEGGTASWVLAVLALLWLLACPALALVVWIALLTLTLLAMIPHPQLRAWVTRARLAISDSIGDSYVLVGRPLCAAAILTRVRGDLDWVAQSCNKAVVIAHSQGGAVAHLLMRAADVPAKVKLLLTFGSGLRKLEDLAHIKSYQRLAGLAAVLIGILMIGVLAGSFVWPSWYWLAAELLLLPFYAVACFQAMTQVGDEELKRWAKRVFKRDERDWEDFHASEDPVPNGTLLDETNPDRDKRVHNRGSMLFDHTSYWENLDEFVSQIALALVDSAGLGVEIRLDPRLKEDIETARIRRLWRVTWLRWTRMIGASLAAVAFWRHHTALVAGIVAGLQGLSSAFERLSPGGSVPQLHTEMAGAGMQWLATALGVAIAPVVYWGVAWSWQIWNRVEVEAFFRRDPVRSGPFVAWLALLSGGAAATIGGLWRGWQSLDETAVWLASGLVLGGAVATWRFARRGSVAYDHTAEFGRGGQS